MNENSNDNNLLYLVPKKELDRLIRIEEKLDRILSLGVSEPKLNGKLGHFISEKEAEHLLGLKYGAMYKLRISGELSFSKVGGKVFYDKREIFKLLEKNQCKAFNKK